MLQLELYQQIGGGTGKECRFHFIPLNLKLA